MASVIPAIPPTPGTPSTIAAPRTSSRDSAAEPPALARPRLPGVDAGRVIAALATVWLHTVANPLAEVGQSASDLAQTTVFGRFAVPYFGFVAGLFIVSGLRSRPGRSVSGYFWERVLRLYLPFLGWSAIFLGVRAIKWHMDGRGFDPDLLGPGVLLAGTAQHLWFLPFLLLAGTAAFALCKATLGDRRRELIVGAIIAVAALVLALWPKPEVFEAVERESRMGIMYFLSRTFNRSPGFMWGVAFGLMYPNRIAMLRVGWAVCLGGLIGTAACLAGVWYWNRNSALENLAGLCWVACALGPWDGPVVRSLARLGTVSYGIYLCHIIFTLGIPIVLAKALQFAGIVVQIDHRPWWFDIIVFVAASIASVLLILALKRSRYTRWLAP